MAFLIMACLWLLCSLVWLPAHVLADITPFSNSKAYNDGQYGPYPNQTFFSEPNAVAPIANVLTHPQAGLSPSRHLVWSPVGNRIKQSSLRLLDAKDLSLVYQGPVFKHEVIGGDVQRCNGTDYLTFWSGELQGGHMVGNHFMMNTDYEIAYNLTGAGNMSGADAHEFFVTPQCTAIFTQYETRAYNMSHWNFETQGWLIDSLFQEIDIATNALLFQWRASDHVDPRGSVIHPHMAGQGHAKGSPFDFFHINSVEKDQKGNYLVSSRHMRSLYYVDGRDGSVLWTLGGTGGPYTDFVDMSNGEATDFGWQHHARWTSAELDSITLFDNGNSEFANAGNHDQPSHPVSRGKLLSLDYNNWTVTLNHSYTAPSDISAVREGSTQMLHDTSGNIVLGYGNEPGFTEFSPNGTILQDVRFGPLKLNRASADNYRALKVNWTGTPTWAPRIAAGPAPSTAFKKWHSTVPASYGSYFHSWPNDTAYFSWNGATNVADWVVLASNHTRELNTTKFFWQQVARTGFEMNVQFGDRASFVRAIALAADGEVLGATPVLDMRWNTLLNETFNETSFAEEWREITVVGPANKRAKRQQIGIMVVMAGSIVAALLIWKWFIVRMLCSKVTSCFNESSHSEDALYEKLETIYEDEEEAYSFYRTSTPKHNARTRVEEIA